MNKADRSNSQQLTKLVPPHSHDAERAVLGCVMLDPRTLDQLESELRAEHFYAEANRQLFNAMVALYERGQPVDALTIKDWLEQKELLASIGGEAYLTELVDAVPTTSNARHYATIVRERSVLRDILAACRDVSRDVFEESDQGAAYHLDEAERRILEIAEHYENSSGKFSNMVDLMAASYRHMEHLYTSQSDLTGIPTGFNDLDTITSGLQRGDLLIIAGRPSMGKTAFVMNLARNAALETDGEQAISIFSLEMSAEQLAIRMLACEARIDMQVMRTGRFTTEDWRRLASGTETLARCKIFIDDTPSIGVLDIRSKCRRLKREHKSLGLVVIDYLQLMSGRANAERRDLQISEMTRSLKGLAKELDVPVIVLSQLNRSLESRADKRPMMSDLRESGAIEQDADVIMFIHRPEVYDKKPENEGLAEIIISKQRNGPIGDIKLSFIKKFTRFENHSSDYESSDSNNVAGF
ncbi:MAG: replicative DNA helicase [Mariprofundales bacterium]